MICDSTSFSTVFQSYQNDNWVIMKKNKLVSSCFFFFAVLLTITEAEQVWLRSRFSEYLQNKNILFLYDPVYSDHKRHTM